MVESESNYKMLRQMTKRERKSTGKRTDAIKAGAKSDDKPSEDSSRKSIPGQAIFKKLTSTTALNLVAFGVACFAIYKYGDKMADYIEGYVPSEKATLEMMKA
jgi:predicted PurR-regulated permease PerM